MIKILISYPYNPRAGTQPCSNLRKVSPDVVLLAALIVCLLLAVIAWCIATVPPTSWHQQRQRHERDYEHSDYLGCHLVGYQLRDPDDVAPGPPARSHISLLLGAIAVGAVTNFMLRLFHYGDATIMVIVWHVGIAAAFALIASLFGRQVLKWPSTPT